MKTFRSMMVSFLLFAITTSDVVVGDGKNNVVYCAEGEPVKPNVPYYISYMTADYKTWICRKNMASNDPKACPQQPIMVANPAIDAPTQVMFVLQSRSDVVRESAKLKIKFVNPSRSCGQSGIWRVVQRTSEEGEVVLNGSKSKSSNDTTFAIHKTDSYYKFTYGDGDYPNTISLSIDFRLLSKRHSSEMEVYFYRNMTTCY